MQDTSAPLWIPITAADKLLALCSDRIGALRDIDDLVARGSIRLWATGVTSLHRNGGSSRQPSGPVQPITWAKIRGSANEPAMWAAGIVTLPASTTDTGLVLRGIRIERAPFVQLLKEYDATGFPLPEQPIAGTLERKRSSGGQKKWKEWDRVWAAVVTIALDERLHRAEFPSQAKLMEEIRDIAGDDIFSDRILKPLVSKIYKDFLQPTGE